MILEKIKNANDIKNIPPESYDALAEEIREFLIQSISFNLGYDGVMSLSVSNINNLPFVY